MQTSIFLSTANGDGQPYIQHRGGPAGFLKVLDEKTIGFADFSGNKQFITQGNLADNPRAFLFLIDYMMRQRIKIWGFSRYSTKRRSASRISPATSNSSRREIWPTIRGPSCS
nr:pyridoxamine 5'-phosphate oxidase family protein [Mesorhizobium sp. LNHC229A00]